MACRLRHITGLLIYQVEELSLLPVNHLLLLHHLLLIVEDQHFLLLELLLKGHCLRLFLLLSVGLSQF